MIKLYRLSPHSSVNAVAATPPNEVNQSTKFYSKCKTGLHILQPLLSVYEVEAKELKIC